MSGTRHAVVIVGPGRVGTVLAAALSRAGHRVVAAGGGRQTSRERFAARFAGARTAADPAEVVPRGDLIVLCTPDDALDGVVRTLAREDAFRSAPRVIHVSGAHGLASLRPAALAGAHVAACHPAQTIPSPDAGPDVLIGAAWAVTAPADERGWATELVRELGGDPYDVPDEARVRYHAALVLGSNAVGAAAAVARQLLRSARVADPSAFLGPLAHASVDNALRDGASALTGPVVRGDAGTVRRHLDELDRDLPRLAEDYRHLTAVIVDLVRAVLPADRVAALDAALGPPSTSADPHDLEPEDGP